MRLGVHMCQLHSTLDLGRAHIATSRCALFAVNLSAFFSSSIHTFTRCMICTHVSFERIFIHNIIYDSQLVSGSAS